MLKEVPLHAEDPEVTKDRTERAKNLGLPQDATWLQINDAMENIKHELRATEAGLPPDATDSEIYEAEIDASRRRSARNLGLPEDTPWPFPK